MSIKITVTAEDILNGEARRDRHLHQRTMSCPIAQTARRVWPEARVSHDTVEHYLNQTR